MAEGTGPARRTATVRFRITAVAVLAAGLVLSVTAIAVVVLQRQALTESLDEALREELSVVAAGVGRDGVAADLDARGDDELVAQLVIDGELVATSRPGPTAIGGGGPTGSGVRIRTVVDLDGLDGDQRVASRSVVLPDGRTAMLHLATPLDDVRESTDALSRALLVVFPLAVAVLGGLVWWLVGRTLRPVEDIRREVASIGGGQVERRVPVPPGHDEVARLARTMNEMLGRSEAAARRQQGFAADASHEMRTPLTRMRTELEVDLAHPGSADPWATHRSVLEEVDGLQRVVADLLLLARFDATGATTAADAPVDVVALVADEAHGPPDGVCITVRGAAGVIRPIQGDAGQLRRVVRNLVDNAVSHARTEVVVSLAQVDGVTRLVVEDDGPGIPADRREQVFERFTRLDTARSADDGGAGLGLAIARGVVARHRGTIRIDDSPTGGARFVVELPTT